MFDYTPCRRLLAGLALATALVSVGQSAPVIRAITLETTGTGRVDPAYVHSRIGSREGEPVNTIRVSNDVKALLETGRFADVAAAIEEYGEGVRLIFRIEPKFRLESQPSISGNRRFSDRKIRNLLDLAPGDPVDNHVMGARTRAVINAYRDARYRDARVDWTFETVDAARGRIRVLVTVDEGDRSTIRRVRVRGNESISRADLREPLRRPPPYNVFRWIWPKRYEPFEITAIAADLRAAYLDAGFLEAAVEADVSEPDDRGRRTATFTVQEGPRYRVGTIAVENITLFAETEVEAHVRLATGAIASQRAIMEGAAAIQSYYGNRGYIDTAVRPALNTDREALTVDITYRVREGELVSLRNINIRGNTRTRDKVIRRELLVQPGETYNQQRIERSERILNNLGFLENIRTVAAPTDDPGRRDLIVMVDEKRSGQFMIGAGFSSVDNIIGFMELSQGNFDLFNWPTFTGAGQKLRLQLQYGRTSQDYQISFTEPWFLDRRLSLGFDVYRRNRRFSAYDETRTGFAVTLGKPLPGPNRVSLRYSLEKSEIRDVSDTNVYYRLPTFDFETGTGEEPFTFTSEEDRFRSTLTLTLLHDTRNSPFVATRGNRVSLSGALTGGPLGFDTDTYELGFQSSHHVPLWFNHVLNFQTRLAVVERYGRTDEVPLADRLFLGGGRTLRGYRFRDVGPKVVRTPAVGSGLVFHRPQGGQSLAAATVEYTIPLVPGMRFAAFYDIGNVWADPYTFELDTLASAAGIGLRLDMPGFPIRIDRAWAIESDDPFTRKDPWVIWIGY